VATTFTLDTKKGLWIEKSPEAKLPYTLNLNDVADPWLGAGETITTAVFTVETGLTILQQSHTTTTATVKLEGGTVGTDYKVLLTWTTDAGVTDSRFFTVKVRERSAG
jgi:hypothetical protein